MAEPVPKNLRQSSTVQVNIFTIFISLVNDFKKRCVSILESVIERQKIGLHATIYRTSSVKNGDHLTAKIQITGNHSQM